jgi:catechol 2,3-dioxygenase-like lactoylglutathione lyase family enzyme
MDIAVHHSFLPHDDPDASLAFYRDALGFEVRNDVGRGRMRWITIGPAGDDGTTIVPAPPTSPARPSSWTRRPPTPASPTTSAAPSPR